MALEALKSALRRPPVETPPFAAQPPADAGMASGAGAGASVAAPTVPSPTFPSPTAPYAAPRYDDEEPLGFPSRPVPADGSTGSGAAASPASVAPPPSAYQPEQFKPVYADPIVGSDTDESAYACPSCGRTLTRGTRRCDGCRTWLVLDVPMRRAGMLAGGGALAGVLVTLLLVNVFAPPKPAAVAVVDPAAATGAGGGAGQPTPVDVSAGAAAALRGTTAINGRLAAEATALSKAIADKPFQAREVVKILRRMAIDTRAGAGMVGPLGEWTAAGAQQAHLQAFYAELGERIDRGLGASVQSAGAYKKAAKQVLATLGDVPGLDAQARALAATAGIELPAVTIPKALQ